MIKQFTKKVFERMFSTSAAGLYTVLFAAAIGVATFIENDFGTSSAQKLIFKSRWFEILLLLFSISLVNNIIKYRMIQNRKWPILTFHAAILVILAGAAVTRYTGSEGMMGIREGSASRTYLSSDSYLQFRLAHQGKTYSFEEPVLFATLGNHHHAWQYLIGDTELSIESVDFIPNPAEVLVDDPNGVPVLKIVIGGMGGREEYLLRYGDQKRIEGTLFQFGKQPIPGAFNIQLDNGKPYFNADRPYQQTVMATRQQDSLPAGADHPLMLRSLYSDGQSQFVFGDFRLKGNAALQSSSQKMESSSIGGVKLRVRFGNASNEIFVTGRQGALGQPSEIQLGNSALSVAYGARNITLPFSIGLRDFIMERYPGTNSASSYASEVTLSDPEHQVQRNQRIYMNHILNYRGYRFFQSSFDQDELGTYLSVNHDAPGTWISYLGYALLTLGMLLTLFHPTSRFRQLAVNLKRARLGQTASVIVAFALSLLTNGSVFAKSPMPNLPEIQPAHAEAFGKVMMQDFNGRTKPMNTFAREILRKLSRKESLYDLSAEQMVLGMTMNPSDWYFVPLIKIGRHEDIRKMLKVDTELARYSDFFDEKGDYKLRDAVRNAFNTAPRDRDVMEKELIKLDEKVNICSMVFSGRFLRVFPIPGDSTQTWQSPVEEGHSHQTHSGVPIVDQFYPLYVKAMQDAEKTGDWSLPGRMIDELKAYQFKYGHAIIPTNAAINAELFSNRLNIFSRLVAYYGLLGLLFLVLLFTSVFKPGLRLHIAGKLAFGAFALCFALHTLGLALRWYISGRAPWSNGYESLIYIGWTTVLAGLIFSRKSWGGLAATSVLASTILMVAGLSWLDPEITPLVPVLKSYWLTIHVSLEAGSYGFLVLGAIIGVLNLVFMIFGNIQNGTNVYRIVKELSWISEMTLIGGLFMISIGTYLGGVWANESWGRYWGWDAKETWALVTILVYSFILHMRFIPGFRGLYAFNVATLFGWASVAMTYFGVNYYLSGLHSYAAGDPVPVPSFVYYTVLTLIALSLLAKWRHSAYLKAGGKV